MENQAAGGCQQPASEAGRVRNFLLPYALVGAGIERGDQAVLASPFDLKSRGEIELARRNLGGEEQISGLRIVSAGRPIAGSRRLSDLGVAPLRSKHAALLVAFDRLAALRSGGIAGGNWLRGRGLLSRFLRNRFFLDIEQRLARDAIQDVNPALFGM